MPNTRDIRNRIKGVKSTRQITRAMQMVATSKMKKAQDEAKTGRPYALILADIIVSIADEFEEITQSYFVQRPITMLTPAITYIYMNACHVYICVCMRL